MERYPTGCLAALLFAGFCGGCVSMAPVHPEPSLHYLSGYTRALAYSPDGRFLVALLRRNENQAVVLDAATLATIRVLEGQEGPRKVLKAPPGAVAFSPDGKRLATAGVDDLVILWETGSWREERRFPDTRWVTDVAFTPDGRSLATAGPGAFARLWDVETGEKVAIFGEHQGAVDAVAVSPTGQFLATGSVDKTVLLWDLKGMAEARQFDQRPVPASSIAFSPDGSLLASSATGLGALLWPVQEGEGGARPPLLATEPTGAALSRVLVFTVGAVSAGAAVAHGGAGTLLLPSTATTLVSKDFACPVAISPDGKLLAVIQRGFSLLGEYQVEIYDVASQRRVAEYMDGLSALAFSPDSRTLAVSGWVRVILLDPYTGEVIAKGP